MADVLRLDSVISSIDDLEKSGMTFMFISIIHVHADYSTVLEFDVVTS